MSVVDQVTGITARVAKSVKTRALPANRTNWVSLAPALLIAGFVILPIAYLAREILTPDVELWQHMWDTFLPQMLENTIILTLGVGVLTFFIGVSYAWLVTAYDFPGRAIFEHAFLLPLAIPTFVMGFVFMALFDFSGPVQTQWRDWFGAEAYFPDIRSAGGVILVMSLVLYPYVYILSRTAFKEQAASTVEASRVMGLSHTKTFFRLVLPMARPSIAAGVTLAMMEAMTDYGTVSFYSFPTLSEGIVRVWEGRFDRAAATQLATVLLLFALGMILLERFLRGRKRFFQEGSTHGKQMSRVPLTGTHRWMAVAACLGLLSIAFFLPLGQLIVWAYQEYHQPSVGAWRSVYMDYIWNTLWFAFVAAASVILLSLLVAYGVRRNAVGSGKRRLPRMITRLVTLGYAMPGAVIAVGVLTLVAPIDHDVTDFVEENFGRTERSLLFTGTMMGLMYAYIVRFMAVGYNSIDSSMEKITPNMEEAARIMGATPRRVLLRIHAPLASMGMAGAAILVFVDVMKEIPATLLLRPFGQDTLALWTYFLASESFWQAAAIPSLTIVVVGLLPVFLLMRVGAYADRH